MKKIILFAAVAVMGLGTWACSSDDNSSNPIKPTYQEAIQGTWKESKLYFLDKDRKVLKEEQASDNDGCGVDVHTFNGEVYTVISNYRVIYGDVNECRTEDIIEKFSIDGNKLTSTYIEDDIEEVTEMEIVSVTETKLILMDLDEVEESSAIEEGWPKGTRFLQMEFTKK